MNPFVAPVLHAAIDVPICRQHPAPDGINDISANSGRNTLNTRQACHTPRGAGVTAITLAFPQFVIGLPERDFPLPYTVRAAIEYPEGVFTAATIAGQDHAEIPPGPAIVSADPLPIEIPADTRFHVRLYVTWMGGEVAFPLNSLGTNTVEGDWLEIGVDHTDHTRDAAFSPVRFGFPHGQLGFPCLVRGRLTAATPILGLIGDSLTQAIHDTPDPIYGGTGYERALRNTVPVVNLGRSGDTLAHYLARSIGRTGCLHGRITHLIFFMGRNDINALRNGYAVWEDLKAAIRPWTASGVQVHGATLPPHTTSSDNWATAAGQRIADPRKEAERRVFNTLLRDNAARIGLAGVLDFARAVDPDETGLWRTDGSPGHGAIGQATLENQTITSVYLPRFALGTTHGGTSYPPNRTDLPCIVTRYADDPRVGDDAVITASTDAKGRVIGFTVREGGTYGIPPMIAPTGAWTADGLHWSTRGLNEAIRRTCLGPALFA